MGITLISYLIIFAPLILTVVFIALWVVIAERKGRVPVKDRLLRSPGGSLQVKGERFDERLPFYLGVLSFLLFAYIGLLSLFLKYRAKSDTLIIESAVFGLLALTATSLVAWLIIKALQNQRNISLGFRGERAVGEELNKLMFDGCLVYHDVPGEGKWNVDHVVVAPTGVYAIETKTRSKDKCAKDRKEYEVIYDGSTLQYPNWNDTHGLDQAKGNARWLAKPLSNALAEEIKVTPILTLPGWLVTSRVRPAGNELRVLNHTQIRSVIVDGSEAVLEDKRIKQIGYQLELKCRD